MINKMLLILGGLAAGCRGFCLAGPDRAAGPSGTGALAGWFGVFPEIPGYRRSFLGPEVGPGGSTTSYRQTARYEWTGGAVKVLNVTLTRDPAFRRDRADEVRVQGATPPQRIEVGGRSGWFWAPGHDAAGRPTGGPHRLVVLLGPVDALVLEAKGPGPWERLPDLAGRFNLGRIEAALRTPPRTDFRRTVATFRALEVGCSGADVVAWAGPADRVTEGATRVLAYHLDDGSRVLLELASQGGLRSARHVRGPGAEPGDVIELVPEPKDDYTES
jgi:hypothetical protein